MQKNVSTKTLVRTPFSEPRASHNCFIFLPYVYLKILLYCIGKDVILVLVHIHIPAQGKQAHIDTYS